jgi:creatinine amidohydrolase
MGQGNGRDDEGANMGVFSSALEREVRLEFMRPAQIDAAKARRAAVYVPVGSIEWHGRQNAVGLDAVKAHEQLIGLALRAGGVVFPPVFFGSGGGHGAYPHSYMFPAQPLRELIAELLRGFQRDGYGSAILLSGHYPNRQQYLDAAIADFRAGGGTMRALAIVENQVLGVPGDHAARWETSYMMYLHPHTVDLAELKGHDHDITGPQEHRNWMGDEFKDHPCYGLLGADPRRTASAKAGQKATERLTEFLVQWLDQADR